MHHTVREFQDILYGNNHCPMIGDYYIRLTSNGWIQAGIVSNTGFFPVRSIRVDLTFSLDENLENLADKLNQTGD